MGLLRRVQRTMRVTIRYYIILVPRPLLCARHHITLLSIHKPFRENYPGVSDVVPRSLDLNTIGCTILHFITHSDTRVPTTTKNNNDKTS
jgi:hypothetical protein